MAHTRRGKTGSLLIAASLVPLVLSTGCQRSCGTYGYQTGLTFFPASDEPPESIDGHELYEICGAGMGSFGSEDLSGDGVGWILFDGAHRNSHISALTSSIMTEVFFPSEQLSPGTTLDLVEAWGYTLENGTSVSIAPFTGGYVEVLETRDDLDPIWGQQSWRMRWDLTWGEPGVSEYWYTTEGEDWIAMFMEGYR